jgi:hypothetical protein
VTGWIKSGALIAVAIQGSRGVALQDIAEHAQHSDINTTRKALHCPVSGNVPSGSKAAVAHRHYCPAMDKLHR